MIAFKQHPGKVVTADSRFKHVMAVALDPSRGFREGVIRCITSRVGDVEISGYVDRSELFRVAANDSFEKVVMKERLVLRNEEAIVSRLNTLGGEKRDFIGLEDPDFFLDQGTGLLHLYFTMPFLFTNRRKKEAVIHLGHAVGKDIDSLEMTEPILMADLNDPNHPGAKELSVAPVNKAGVRFNLVESSKREADFNYSTVRVAVAEDMGKPWRFGETVFHPKEHGIPWIGGHASPGPLLPRSFIDIGEGKLVGIMNGREANQKVGDKTKYGMFSVGLFIYDYEKGKIDWVSPEPLIRDTEAVTITFASQFIETGSGSDGGGREGILYAHVDDSFVRAYSLYADGLRELIPKNR